MFSFIQQQVEKANESRLLDAIPKIAQIPITTDISQIEESKIIAPKPETDIPKILPLENIKFNDYMLPVYNKEDQGVTGIELESLEPHFCYLLIGPPGSGKSTLLYNFLYSPALYNKKFDRVLILSPSPIVGMDEIQTKPAFYSSKLDLLWLRDRIMSADKEAKDRQNYNLLIIFDDLISQIRDSRDAYMNEIVVNRRHLLSNNGCVSIVFTSQKYLGLVPTLIRNNISGLFLFTPSLMDVRAINSEFWGFPFGKLWSWIKSIYTSSYLQRKFGKYIFFHWKRINSTFYVNFNKILLSHFSFID